MRSVGMTGIPQRHSSVIVRHYVTCQQGHFGFSNLLRFIVLPCSIPLICVRGEGNHIRPFDFKVRMNEMIRTNQIWNWMNRKTHECKMQITRSIFFCIIKWIYYPTAPQSMCHVMHICTALWIYSIKTRRIDERYIDGCCSIRHTSQYIYILLDTEGTLQFHKHWSTLLVLEMQRARHSEGAVLSMECKQIEFNASITHLTNNSHLINRDG